MIHLKLTHKKETDKQTLALMEICKDQTIILLTIK